MYCLNFWHFLFFMQIVEFSSWILEFLNSWILARFFEVLIGSICFNWGQQHNLQVWFDLELFRACFGTKCVLPCYCSRALFMLCSCWFWWKFCTNLMLIVWAFEVVCCWLDFLWESEAKSLQFWLQLVEFWWCCCCIFLVYSSCVNAHKVFVSLLQRQFSCVLCV